MTKEIKDAEKHATDAMDFWKRKITEGTFGESERNHVIEVLTKLIREYLVYFFQPGGDVLSLNFSLVQDHSGEPLFWYSLANSDGLAVVDAAGEFTSVFGLETIEEAWRTREVDRIFENLQTLVKPVMVETPVASSTTGH